MILTIIFFLILFLWIKLFLSVQHNSSRANLIAYLKILQIRSKNKKNL